MDLCWVCPQPFMPCITYLPQAVPTPSATPSAAKDTPSTGKAAASVPKGKSPRDSTAAAAAAPPSAAAKKAKAAAKPAFATDANAAAAIAAVDAAAATLPPPDQVKFSLIPEGADAAGNDSTEPPNYGNKVGGAAIRPAGLAIRAVRQTHCSFLRRGAHAACTTSARACRHHASRECVDNVQQLALLIAGTRPGAVPMPPFTYRITRPPIRHP